MKECCPHHITQNKCNFYDWHNNAKADTVHFWITFLQKSFHGDGLSLHPFTKDLYPQTSFSWTSRSLISLPFPIFSWTNIITEALQRKSHSPLDFKIILCYPWSILGMWQRAESCPVVYLFVAVIFIEQWHLQMHQLR